ncbi:hypothetical protein CV_0862 [Chromobacterium violaceum ATCC 12472]|uniref:Uncharacterized protein n=1 Tax=Chromobacterium violaceum (strain ATCC 12472 / DSM 30191 / JCM 1249 / CCUG 213 / NBRC 12614 / NCIMB 9131 / NCTC 9757 / MK) TaxID=243365 RepID=Q7NZQ9_CHRVO|nr:hypothetical protein CV_0862 [Chromobacterium violaceum ATCC 12472]
MGTESLLLTQPRGPIRTIQNKSSFPLPIDYVNMGWIVIVCPYHHPVTIPLQHIWHIRLVMG